ncbi:hypothetical protein V5296_21010, partial [Escherichia coli]
MYQQVHFALWEQVIATQLRTEGLHEDRTPVWRLRGLNLTATESAFRCCSGILQPEKIKRLFMRISKKAMHQF